MTDQQAKRTVRINLIAIIIFGFGLSQMVGYLLKVPALRGLGGASTIAPFPKVFSDVDGIETFASSFAIQFTDREGRLQQMAITPEVYATLAGPYNRRNVYGAAFSYGPTPRFPKPLFDCVFQYGLIDPGPLREEFGLPADMLDVRMIIETKTRGRDDRWELPKVDE